jgi:hypothetical protein
LERCFGPPGGRSSPPRRRLISVFQFELAEPIFQKIGQLRHAQQVLGGPIIVLIMGDLEGFVPFVLAKIAAPDPGQRDDLALIVVIDGTDPAFQLVIGGVVCICLGGFSILGAGQSAAKAFFCDALWGRNRGLRFKFPGFGDDECDLSDIDFKHGIYSSCLSIVIINQPESAALMLVKLGGKASSARAMFRETGARTGNLVYNSPKATPEGESTIDV